MTGVPMWRIRSRQRARNEISETPGQRTSRGLTAALLDPSGPENRERAGTYTGDKVHATDSDGVRRLADLGVGPPKPSATFTMLGPESAEPCRDCGQPRHDFQDARSYVSATAELCGECMAEVRDADFALGAD